MGLFLIFFAHSKTRQSWRGIDSTSPVHYSPSAGPDYHYCSSRLTYGVIRIIHKSIWSLVHLLAWEPHFYSGNCACYSLMLMLHGNFETVIDHTDPGITLYTYQARGSPDEKPVIFFTVTATRSINRKIHLAVEQGESLH